MAHRNEILELSVMLEKALQERSIKYSPDKQSVSHSFMAGYYVTFTEGLLEDLQLTNEQLDIVKRRFHFSAMPPESLH